MTSLRQDIAELERQLESGSIARAYRALMSFMAGLRTDLQRAYGEKAVSGLYQGYLDMAYVAVSPSPLKEHGLKVAVVFNFEAFRFEAWLAARNRQTQREYWESFRSVDWDGYRVVEPTSGVDSILERDIAHGFDPEVADMLTKRIEDAIAEMIDRVGDALETKGR